MKNVFLDVETTDFMPGQIAQLSYIIEHRGQIEKVKNFYFTVLDMKSSAQKTHGLSVDKLKELSFGQQFSDSYSEIYNDINGQNIVAHNVGFDVKFLSSELWRCGISLKLGATTCSMKYFKDILMVPNRYKRYGKFKNPKLVEIIDYFNLDKEKIINYSKQLFNDDRQTLDEHNSIFDTTSLYVVTNINRESVVGVDDWRYRFSK